MAEIQDATQGQDPDMEPEVFDAEQVEVSPVRRGGTQASYDAARRERKLRAADTVAANAKSAQRAKTRAQAKATSFDDGGLAKAAAPIEKRINQRAQARLKAEPARNPAEVVK